MGKGDTVIEIAGVDNAKSYQVGVRARNKNGDSGWINSNTIGPLDIRLAVGSVTGSTAVITLSNHDGDWHYQADAAPDDSCSAAQSGRTVNLTGLTSGTTYTYKAYQDASCANLMATAEPFTAGDTVTVDNLEKASGLYAYQVGRVHEPHMKAMVRHSTHFTTGGNENGYTLDQVTVSLGASDGSPTGLTAKIYSGVVSDGKNLPNAMVKSLGKKTPTSNGEVTWSCSGTGCGLSANTTYHLVLEGEAPSSGDHHYTWVTAQSYAQVNTPEDAGWLISNGGFRQDDDGRLGRRRAYSRQTERDGDSQVAIPRDGSEPGQRGPSSTGRAISYGNRKYVRDGPPGSADDWKIGTGGSGTERAMVNWPAANSETGSPGGNPGIRTRQTTSDGRRMTHAPAHLDKPSESPSAGVSIGSTVH